MPENIGIKIKKIRDSLNLSQSRFGKKVGLSGKTVSAYETGKVKPPIKVIEKISTEYNLPLVYVNKKTSNELKRRIVLIEKQLDSLKVLIENNVNL